MPVDRRQFLMSAVASGWVVAVARDAGAAAADTAIEDLIGRMTLEEKAGQLHMEPALSLHMADPEIAKLNPFMPATTPIAARAAFVDQIARIKSGGIGSLMTPMDLESTSLAQNAACRESRLKIPLFFAADVIHGRKTVFPVPLAEAASFEPDLARRTARASAIEATADGLDVTFAPMVDIGRDQRWGRVVEGAGEDVLLGSLFAAARVAGFQGQKAAADSLLACVKHFAAYGAAEAGLDYQGNALSDRVLHEVYLPPFKAAFDAGAILAMASFNTIDGVPSTGNHKLLTDILRGTLGFTGAVVSDFESEKELIAHGQAADEADAARIALAAGCDIGMVSGIFPRHVPDLVRSGALDPETLDRAVRRMLIVKRDAGLFADPFRRIDARRKRRSTPPAHRELAREAARKSVVLLKNDGGILPLKKAGQRIALIGPFAEDQANLNGPWSPFVTEAPSVPLAVGLRSAMSEPALLRVVRGSDIETAVPGGIEDATDAARAADVVIMAIGESEAMSGESASRAEIVIPGAQQSLVDAVATAGRPMVIVLRNGRALALTGAVRDAHAIVVGWFLGSETGHALADVLFGDHSPSGRLPLSFPLASGQEPYYYARESSGRPALDRSTERFTSHFLGLADAPLYAFGHGLSYSPVRYGATTCAATPIATGASVELSCDITNAGDRPVEEVAQLYVHVLAAEVVQPVRKLVAFRKLALAAGATKSVTFTVDSVALGHLDRELRRVAPSGAIDAWIAPSAIGGTPVRFAMLPPDRAPV
jgi:beta-glucosidase